MPRGWYLAQGLYPLGPSSSDDEEGPCTLPNGRIVCGPHGLVTCDKCCTSYDFMDSDDEEEDLDDDDDEEEEDVDDDDEGPIPEALLDCPPKRRGTGQVIPTKFTPPTSSILPTELFPGRRTYANLTR